MIVLGRATLCLSLLAAGVGAQAALETWSRIERPGLREPLVSLPKMVGEWTGRDMEVDPKILAESQATECVSRAYENSKFPGVVLTLWINFSIQGDNMRHSPKICLPSHGGTEIESQTRVLSISGPSGRDLPVTRLGYQLGESVTGVGFWYYIFGEGKIEQWVRGLPVTSRSSHGRTTRGSGLTVEVFWNAEADPQATAFTDFARTLLVALDPILPAQRAEYHVP